MSHLPAYPRAQRVVGAHARGVRGRVIWDPRFVERR
jgi:lambda repressor-like predicted transcriptional regulator